MPVFDKKHQVTKIDVIFIGLLSSSEASNTSFLTLKMPGNKNSFTAKNAKTIKLKSAALNPATDTVVLTPKMAFAVMKPVQLTMNANQLQDSIGRSVDGNGDGDGDGAAGGNRVVVITRKAVTITS